MKKSSKIVLIIIVLILVLVGLFLIFKDRFLSNVEPKFSDLVCTRDISNSTVDIKEVAEFIFQFDNQGLVIGYTENRVYTFTTESEAQEQFDYFLEYSDASIKLEGNEIFSTIKYDIIENEGYYGMSKEELKEYYENDFKYFCE